MEHFLPSEVARLVLGYLKEENCMKAYKNFLSECIHLKEYADMMKMGREYPTSIAGKSLKEMLNEYGAAKIVELHNPNFQERALWLKFDTVVAQLKSVLTTDIQTSATYKRAGKQGQRTRRGNINRAMAQAKILQPEGSYDIPKSDENNSTYVSPQDKNVTSHNKVMVRPHTPFQLNMSQCTDTGSVPGSPGNCLQIVTSPAPSLSANHADAQDCGTSHASSTPIKKASKDSICIPVYIPTTRPLARTSATSCTLLNTSGSNLILCRRTASSVTKVNPSSQGLQSNPQGTCTTVTTYSRNLSLCSADINVQNTKKSAESSVTETSKPIEVKQAEPSKKETEVSQPHVEKNVNISVSKDSVVCETPVVSACQEQTKPSALCRMPVVGAPQGDIKLSTGDASKPLTLDTSSATSSQNQAGPGHGHHQGDSQDNSQHSFDSNVIENQSSGEDSTHVTDVQLPGHEHGHDAAAAETGEDMEVQSICSSVLTTPNKNPESSQLLMFGKSPRRKTRAPKRRSHGNPIACKPPILLNENSTAAEDLTQRDLQDMPQVLEQLISNVHFTEKLANTINKVKFASKTVEKTDQVDKMDTSSGGVGPEKVGVTENDKTKTDEQEKVNNVSGQSDSGGSSQGVDNVEKKRHNEEDRNPAKHTDGTEENNNVGARNSDKGTAALDKETDKETQPSAYNCSELDAILDMGESQMSGDTVTDIIQMTRYDKDFDALFNLFNVDKHQFIEQEYGVPVQTTSPSNTMDAIISTTADSQSGTVGMNPSTSTSFRFSPSDFTSDHCSFTPPSSLQTQPSQTCVTSYNQSDSTHSPLITSMPTQPCLPPATQSLQAYNGLSSTVEPYHSHSSQTRSLEPLQMQSSQVTLQSSQSQPNVVHLSNLVQPSLTYSQSQVCLQTSSHTQIGVLSHQSQSDLTSNQSQPGLTVNQSRAELTSSQSGTGLSSNHLQTGLTPNQSQGDLTSNQSQTGITSNQSQAGLTSNQLQTDLASNHNQADQSSRCREETGQNLSIDKTPLVGTSVTVSAVAHADSLHSSPANTYREPIYSSKISVQELLISSHSQSPTTTKNISGTSPAYGNMDMCIPTDVKNCRKQSSPIGSRPAGSPFPGFCVERTPPDISEVSADGSSRSQQTSPSVSSVSMRIPNKPTSMKLYEVTYSSPRGDPKQNHKSLYEQPQTIQVLHLPEDSQDSNAHIETLQVVFSPTKVDQTPTLRVTEVLGSTKKALRNIYDDKVNCFSLGLQNETHSTNNQHTGFSAGGIQQRSPAGQDGDSCGNCLPDLVTTSQPDGIWQGSNEVMMCVKDSETGQGIGDNKSCTQARSGKNQNKSQDGKTGRRTMSRSGNKGTNKEQPPTPDISLILVPGKQGKLPIPPLKPAVISTPKKKRQGNRKPRAKREAKVTTPAKIAPKQSCQMSSPGTHQPNILTRRQKSMSSSPRPLQTITSIANCASVPMVASIPGGLATLPSSNSSTHTKFPGVTPLHGTVLRCNTGTSPPIQGGTTVLDVSSIGIKDNNMVLPGSQVAQATTDFRFSTINADALKAICSPVQVNSVEDPTESPVVGQKSKGRPKKGKKVTKMEETEKLSKKTGKPSQTGGMQQVGQLKQQTKGVMEKALVHVRQLDFLSEETAKNGPPNPAPVVKTTKPRPRKASGNKLQVLLPACSMRKAATVPKIQPLPVVVPQQPHSVPFVTGTITRQLGVATSEPPPGVPVTMTQPGSVSSTHILSHHQGRRPSRSVFKGSRNSRKKKVNIPSEGTGITVEDVEVLSGAETVTCQWNTPIIVDTPSPKNLASPLAQSTHLKHELNTSHSLPDMPLNFDCVHDPGPSEDAAIVKYVDHEEVVNHNNSVLGSPDIQENLFETAAKPEQTKTEKTEIQQHVKTKASREKKQEPSSRESTSLASSVGNSAVEFQEALLMLQNSMVPKDQPQHTRESEERQSASAENNVQEPAKVASEPNPPKVHSATRCSRTALDSRESEIPVAEALVALSQTPTKDVHVHTVQENLAFKTPMKQPRQSVEYTKISPLRSQPLSKLIEQSFESLGQTSASRSKVEGQEARKPSLKRKKHGCRGSVDEHQHPVKKVKKSKAVKTSEKTDRKMSLDNIDIESFLSKIHNKKSKR